MNLRPERVADLVRAELATILRREMKDPRVGLASISDVVVSRDLKHARVRVSVLGEEETREEAVETLRGAKGFLRSLLARRLRLRTVPDLRFELDRGAEHSQRINEILEGLHDDAERGS